MYQADGKKGHLPGFEKKVLGKVRSGSFKTPVCPRGLLYEAAATPASNKSI